MRPTMMEVSLGALKHNIHEIEKYMSLNRKDTEIPKIMPVVKANAYGTYLHLHNEILEHFDIVAVAVASEGAALRENGFSKEILVLNQPDESEIEELLQNHITIGVSDVSFVKRLGETLEMWKKSTVKEGVEPAKARVHIEIDTGMGRTGIRPEDTVKFIQKIQENSHILIEGIYTHLSSADYDEDYTNEQLEKFARAVQDARGLLGEIKYVHCSASNGILNYSNDQHHLYCNLVRAGIILYGYESFDNMYEKIDLKPVCRLKSKITFLKEVEADTSIGYSRKFITQRKTRVATVPIGYADGLRRMLSNKGEVLICGKRAPIIGNVCMDSFMVDVTEIPGVSLGDDVYIWDNDKITLEEVAKNCGTINYEIMCTISDRVERVYVN
ncbi:MAG: alanine racemase [Clostridia bacterium]|nr:alanine racemase [Clostridia bacterium]